MQITNKVRSLPNYFYEIATILFILLFAVSCGDGKQKNESWLLEQAQKQLDTCSYTNAEQLFGNLTKLNPTNFLYYQKLGTAQYYAGELEKALTSYGRACDLSPTNMQLIYNRSFVEFELEMFTNAITDSDLVLKQEPLNEAANTVRGYSAFCLGQLDVANKAFRRSIEICSNSAGAFTGLSMVSRAEMRLNDAKKLIETAIKSNSGSSSLYKQLGMILFDSCDYSNALNNFNISISIEAGQIDVLNRIYLCRIRMGGMETLKMELKKKVSSSEQHGLAPAMEIVGIYTPTILEVESYLSGVLSETNFFLHATNKVWDAKNRKEQLQQACFVAGIVHFSSNDLAGGKRFFEDCIGLGQPLTCRDSVFDDYLSAKVLAKFADQ